MSPRSERLNAGASRLPSKLGVNSINKHANMRQVIMRVKITEAISSEWSNWGVEWQFWGLGGICLRQAGLLRRPRRLRMSKCQVVLCGARRYVTNRTEERHVRPCGTNVGHPEQKLVKDPGQTEATRPDIRPDLLP